MKKILLMAVAAIMTISASAQETVKKVRVYEGNKIAYEQNYTQVDSIVFVNEETPTELEGTLSGKFSVPVGEPIQFSQGNLQYQPVTNTWRFAEHQYDIIGSAGNSYISSDYNGWIDLFCWGTGNNPTLHTKEASDYTIYTDWGVNPISNGGNTPNQWRTLTYDEWRYILSARPNASKLKSNGKVNNVYGYIILPDDWVLPDGLEFVSGVYKNFDYNNYNTIQWAKMEAAGAVFLPQTAVVRYGTSCSTYQTNINCHYWTATPYSEEEAWALYIYYNSYSGGTCTYGTMKIYYGLPVRLVH